jgi:lipopolysaccharide biosynthesis regulator YciM
VVLAEALAKDATLDRPHEVAGLSAVCAERERRFAEADRLDEQAWAVITKPDATPEVVATALGQATRAAALDPASPAIAVTLGAAQYRAGKCEAAVTALTRNAERSGDLLLPRKAGATAFLALAQHRLGRTEDAKATLARLRELVAGHTDNAEAQALLKEAEVLIQGQAPASAK